MSVNGNQIGSFFKGAKILFSFLEEAFHHFQLLLDELPGFPHFLVSLIHVGLMVDFCNSVGDTRGFFGCFRCGGDVDDIGLTFSLGLDLGFKGGNYSLILFSITDLCGGDPFGNQPHRFGGTFHYGKTGYNHRLGGDIIPQGPGDSPI